MVSSTTSSATAASSATAEVVLEQTRRQFNELQQLAKLGSWEFDVRANAVSWTDGLYSIYGLTRETFSATFEGYIERVHPDDRERVIRTIGGALERGGPFEFEERIVRPDGDVRTLLSVGRVVADEHGAPLQLIGVCRDITDERNATRALERRERELAHAQHLAHLGSWSYDIDAGVITWSDEMYRIYGMEPGKPVTYERYVERIHPDDRAVVLANVATAIHTLASFEHEHRITRADGEERIVLGHGDVAQDASGRAVTMYGTGQDVTDRRRADQQALALVREQIAREEAELAAARLAFLAEASVVLASSLDYEETLRNVARLAVPKVADWCAVDIITQSNGVKRLAVEHVDPTKVRFAMEMEQRYPADPDAPTGVPQVLRTGETEWVEVIPDALLEAVAVDSTHLQLIRELGLHSYAVVPLSISGDTIGAMTFVHAESKRTFTPADVVLLTSLARRAAIAIHNARLMRALTDAHATLQGQREELEAQASELEETMAELEMRNEEMEWKTEEAEAARVQAEHANAAKSQFLANMSHELRTPLNAIGGYAQLMQLGVHGPMTDQQLSSIDRIRANQLRLLALINDLLNFVKLRAGHLKIALAPEPLHELLQGMAPLVEPQVLEKSLVLTIHDCDADICVMANRERTEQVLLNLLSNAVKFTPEAGSIEITVEDDPREVRIRVTDTGCGIPAEKLDDIFEPFVQIGPTTTRDNQGVGLGLAISRDLMIGMGGSLTVESTPGSGSRFTITLARAPRAAAVTSDSIAV